MSAQLQPNHDAHCHRHGWAGVGPGRVPGHSAGLLADLHSCYGAGDRIVIGFTQLLNSAAKLHGWAAVGQALVVSIGYFFAMYLSQGVAFCAIVAVAAFIPAVLFYKGTTSLGKVI